MKQLLLLFSFSAMISLAGTTQSVTPSITNAGGGSYQSPSTYFRYFDWSIGELILISTVAPSDSSIVLYQGVLQPCTEKPGFSQPSSNFTLEDLKIMPNPTTGLFEVNLFVRERGQLELELVDALGQVLERRVFRYNGNFLTERYDISHLPAGIYLLSATLKPEPGDYLGNNHYPRHSGFKIVKLR